MVDRHFKIYKEGEIAFLEEQARVLTAHTSQNWKENQHLFNQLLEEGENSLRVWVRNPYPVHSTESVVWQAGFDDQKR